MNQIQLIALRIADLRDISGLSAEEVASRSGVPLEEYLAYEKGEKDFSFSHLFNIAETLGVDISDLLTGESPKLRGYVLTRAGKGLAFDRRKQYHYQHLAYNFAHKLAEPFIVTVEQDAPGTVKQARNQPYSHFAPQRSPTGAGRNVRRAASSGVRWSNVVQYAVSTSATQRT